MKSNEELADLKKSLKEVIREERLSTMEAYASKKEMVEILQKQPSSMSFNESEFIDMTDWVKK